MKKFLTGIVLLLMLLPVSVMGGVLSTVGEQAVIRPMNDGSGNYMLKSTGFYCLHEDGTLCETEEIHYLDHFEIDGTVFSGLYYHDADGRFTAGNPYYKEITGAQAVISKEGKDAYEMQFQGIFRIGSLGKMSGTPSVVYLEEQVGSVLLQGFYYVNENGRVVREPGIHTLHIECQDRVFDGQYYFGTDGALVTEACVTPEGYTVDEDGMVKLPQDAGLDGLKIMLETQIADYDGHWSIYLKEFASNEELRIEDTPIGSASLIKMYVMAAVYDRMDKILANQAALLGLKPEDPKVKKAVDDLLWNMITISDNEAYNELVRLQTPDYDFKKGCLTINAWLNEQGFSVTRACHTLQPSGTPDEGIDGINVTTAKECGTMLERIYRGECVSEEASAEMLHLLTNQRVNWKIRAGLPKDIVCANKSGENNNYQHDVGIVFGENTEYELCIMIENYKNENQTFDDIRDVSSTVYSYLNMWGSLGEE